MARIPLITSREQVRAEQRPLVDDATGGQETIGGPTALFLNSPGFAVPYSRMARYVRRESLISYDHLELVALSVAREFDCPFIWAVNRPQTEAAGLSESTTSAIEELSDLSSLPEGQRTIAVYIRELLQNKRVSDGVFRAAQQQVGDAYLLEVTAFVGFYAFLAYSFNAFEMEPAPDAPKLAPRSQ